MTGETRAERFLSAAGWEIDGMDRSGVYSWRRDHPNDVAEYSTRRAIWLTLTGRRRRGGWNASWRLWIKAGR